MPSPTTRKPENREGLLDASEVARELGVSLRLVRKLTAEGELSYTRVGRLVRFSREHLDAFLAANERGGKR